MENELVEVLSPGAPAEVVPGESEITAPAPEGNVEVAPAAKKRKRYTYQLSAKDDDFILECIEKHKTLAFIAEKIGCSRFRLGEYIHKIPILQQAFTDAKDAMDDLAELRLFEKINRGDLGAIMFYMPRQMRHRGYGDVPMEEEKQEEQRVVLGVISKEEEDEAAEIIKRAEAAANEPPPSPDAPAEDEPLLPGGVPVADEPQLPAPPAAPADEARPEPAPEYAMLGSSQADDEWGGPDEGGGEVYEEEW